MNRLHVPKAEITSNRLIIRGDSHSYLREVLRLRAGALVEVFDGEGGIYPSVLERYVEGGAQLVLGEREERSFEGVEVTLLQGLAKGDKFELVIQKAVELGVTRVVPVATERSVVRLDARKAESRVQRWQKIADEACRQCQRAHVATVEKVMDLSASLESYGAKPSPAADEPRELRLILDEEERKLRFSQTLLPKARYTLLVGPEGGFTRDEVSRAQAAGFVPVTLGPRILRTETAALAALAILQNLQGDLG